MNNCVICKKPIDGKFIKVSFYGKTNNGPHLCHIARKCTDKLPFTASERAEMDRVIALELDRE